MISIRTMGEEDAERVAELEVLAFGAYWRQTGLPGGMPLRTPNNLRAAMAINPAGCLVAAAPRDGDLHGFVFSRAWGTLGWIGTFGVHPEHQGLGVGRKLLLAAVEQLKHAGCTTIGLETMPDSPANVGFYLRSGFVLAEPIVSMVRQLGPAAAEVPDWRLLAGADDGEGLAAVARVSAEARPGLDYRPEALNAAALGWGHTLLIGTPRPWALAIVRTVPLRRQGGEALADVRALAVEPAARASLPQALDAAEAFVRQQGLSQMSVATNGADRQWPWRPLHAGYRVNRVMLRLIHGGEMEPAAGLDWARWKM